MRKRTGLLGLIWVMCLLLAVLQAAFFVPLVAEGRSLDFGPYRVDGLGLIFALGWTLAVALSAPGLAAHLSTARTGYLLLLWLALLNMAYAREPWLLYLAWEVAALSLWPALRANGTSSLRWAVAAVHLAGVPFAAALLLGLIQPFTPPAGGEATAWSLPVVLVLGAAAYIRAGAWPFDSWVRATLPSAGEGATPLVMLYLTAAPFVLTKALVAAPWDPYDVWTLALLGTVGLIGAALSTFWNIHPPAVIPTAVVATGIIGFGLASPSPLAALGAVPLLLAAALWPALRTLSSVRPYALLLAGLLLAVWLLSQGALDLRYNLVGVALLPALVMLALLAASASDKAREHSRSATVAALVAAILLALAAIYPQALIEWVARPAVSAMAGGVGVPSALVRDWGVGLLIRSPDETILAALPATGMALAVFLAWLPLYWLKRLARNVRDAS